MSANKFNLTSIYNQSHEKFFKNFVWVYFLYIAGKLFLFDPTVFSALNPIFGKSPGLLHFFNINSIGIVQMRLIQGIGIVASLFAAIGQGYRFSAMIAVGSWLVMDLFRNQLGFINIEIHVFWIGILMVFAPLEKKNRRSLAGLPYLSWAFVFIQLIIVLAYFQSGIAKIWSSGLDWALEGTTLQFALYRQQEPLGILMSRYSIFAKVGAMTAVAFEILFGFYFLVPALKRPLLLASLFFHIGTFILLGITFEHLWFVSFSLLLWGDLGIEKKPLALD